MTLKKLLVPMTGFGEEVPALATAFAIAKSTGAHVDALFMGRCPQQEMTSGDCFPPAVIDHIMSTTVIDRMIKDAENRNEKGRLRTRFLFNRLVQYHAAAIDAEPGEGEFSATYVEAPCPVGSLMAHYGRLCDLIVMEWDVRQGTEPMAGIEDALRDSGRPVLTTPRAMPPGFAKSIAIAWNGSLEATRMIGFAMPLLEQADKVMVLTIKDDKLSGPPATDLIEYLAWHGVSAVLVSVCRGSQGRSEALLSEARKQKADLVMLGGCAFCDIRRLASNGTARAVLVESPIPLLMMH